MDLEAPMKSALALATEQHEKRDAYSMLKELQPRKRMDAKLDDCSYLATFELRSIYASYQPYLDLIDERDFKDVNPESMTLLTNLLEKFSHDNSYPRTKKPNGPLTLI
jgi:hypothetical protein